MGLLLSIFVVCVGVIEVLSCYQHFQYGVLRYATNIYENARKRNSVFLNYKSRRSKLKSESSVVEAADEEKTFFLETPPRFSDEFEAIIKDIAKSQELHLLQLQQQHLQLQLQIARLKEENKEKEKLEEKKNEKLKVFGKEEKIDMVKKLLNKAPKAIRSISMPERILTKKDIEIEKIIDELANEPSDELDIVIDIVDSETLTNEFDKIFDESENVLKASKRLIEKRPSLTEIAYLTESAEGKVFGGVGHEHDFACQTVEDTTLEKPVEKLQFEEATPHQEIFYSQKALMSDSSVQKDLEKIPYLDKSTSIDLIEPTITRATSIDEVASTDASTSVDFESACKSISTADDLIPISKSTSMEALNPVCKSTSTNFEDLVPVNKSTSIDYEDLNPVSKSTSMNFEDLIAISKSTSMDFGDVIPVNKSTSIDYNDIEPINKFTSTDNNFIPVNKSTSMDFSGLIPINKSTSMDFSNFIPVNKSTSMDFSNILKDSSTQMNFIGRNSSTDLEDFYSVSESEDEETIHVDLNTKKKKVSTISLEKESNVIPTNVDTFVDDNNNRSRLREVNSKQTEPSPIDRKEIIEKKSQANEKTDNELEVSQVVKKIKTDQSFGLDSVPDDCKSEITSRNVEGQAIIKPKCESPMELDKSDSTLSEDSSETIQKVKGIQDEKQNPTKEAFWLIFSGEYTKAMSKDWHSGHFSCWQCDEALTGQRYVLRDDHPYCIKCYESVFANVCEECNKIIGIDSKDLSYKDKHWHEACFLCNKCRVSLVDKQFGSKADKIYCGNCYDAQFASRCDGCGEIFRAGTKKMEYKTRQWHEKCFCCCVCKTPIGTKSFIPREQEIYCATCYEEKFATRCVKCNKIITSGGVTYKNEPWHRECFTCTNCNTSLAGQRFTSRDEKPYCADCFGELFAKRCTACSRPITGIGGTRFISFEDRHWHNDCFICASCKTSLVGRGFITDGDDIICPECAKQKLM